MRYRALVFEGRRKPLSIQEIERPAYTTEEFIEVKLKSAALNRRDYWITKGLYPDIKGNVPTVLGSDGCGIYESKECIICPNVNWGFGEFPGSDYTILGLQEHGTLAERIYVRKDKIHPKPKHLSVSEAACLPLAGLTAYRTLFSRCKTKKGQNVLISGVGGGVALLACQMAIAIGANVYVTSSSSDKIKRAKLLGAIDGADYNDIDGMTEMAKSINGFDVVIDSAGGSGFNQLLKMCRLGANVGIYGGTVGSISGVAVPNLFFKQISIHGSTMGSDLEFKAMLDLVNEYSIIPVIDNVRSLDDAAISIGDMEKNTQFGKQIIEIAN